MGFILSLGSVLWVFLRWADESKWLARGERVVRRLLRPKRRYRVALELAFEVISVRFSGAELQLENS
jgi:hypothetical protein